MQCNAMQCNAMQCNAMQCNAMQYNSIQYKKIQYNTIQFNKYNTIQYNTIQYNTIQYNTIQFNSIQFNSIQFNSIQYNTKHMHFAVCRTSHLPDGMCAYNPIQCANINQCFANLSCRWKGDYGGKKNMWFPSNYVEEVTTPPGTDQGQNQTLLGNLQKGAIDITGCSVGKFNPRLKFS